MRSLYTRESEFNAGSCTENSGALKTLIDLSTKVQRATFDCTQYHDGFVPGLDE